MVLFEGLYWTKVFPETIRKPSTGFANVQLVTALARDNVDFTSHSTVELLAFVTVAVLPVKSHVQHRDL